MRTIFRLCLVASLVAAVGFAAVPIAEAKNRPGHVNLGGVAQNGDKKQNKQIRKLRKEARQAHKRIKRLKDWNFGLAAKNRDQDSDFNALKVVVDGAIPVVTQALTDLQSGLLAVKNVLENDVADAFDDIEDALNDPVTGLVGLNLARPQFGVFLGDGDFQGGTGTVASGPSDDAFRAGAGTYVVDFGNDVSERVIHVTPFPGSVPLAVSAVNCAVGAPLSPSIDGACDAAAGADASHPDRVFVLIQNSATGAPTDNPFQVTAISG